MATGNHTKICKSPFCLYLTVALGLNIPPIVYSGMTWGKGGGYGGNEGCTSASNWLNLNALLCFVNIAVAIYLSAKITYEPEDNLAAPFVEASVHNHETTKAAEEQPPTKDDRGSIVKKMMEGTLDSNHTRSRSFDRVKDILCYDPVVALYIIVGIFYMVWQTMGVGRVNLAANCGGGLDEFVSKSLMCGFGFIWFGGMTFSISLCCLARR